MASRKSAKRKKKRRGLGNVQAASPVLIVGNGYQQSSPVKWKVIGWTLGFIGFGTACYFGYRYFKNSQQGKVEDKSLSIGNPENYAMHLKKAFDNDGWPGTNNDAVFETFEEMPSYKAFLAMKKSYYKLTGKVFEHDLDDEMSLKELKKIEDILKKKPDTPSAGVSLSVSKS